MQGQDFAARGVTSRESESLTDKIADAANQVYATTGEVAGEAAERARQAASEATSSASAQAKELLDRQVGAGAAMLGSFAHSVHRAADDLDKSSPLVGDLTRTIAHRMSGYAGALDGKTSDDLLRSASDLTRRQPALVFGLAALAGFFAFRAVKNAPTGMPTGIRAPSIQPNQSGFDVDENGWGPDGVQPASRKAQPSSGSAS